MKLLLKPLEKGIYFKQQLICPGVFAPNQYKEGIYKNNKSSSQDLHAVLANVAKETYV